MGELHNGIWYAWSEQFFSSGPTLGCGARGRHSPGRLGLLSPAVQRYACAVTATVCYTEGTRKLIIDVGLFLST